MLEGKNVNLRVMEKEDLPLFEEWTNNSEFMGEYEAPYQRSRAEIEKSLEKASESPYEPRVFIVEKKDGSKIGYVVHFNMLHPTGKLLEIGYALAPSERRKGYCTEAAQLMVDYLFLSMGIPRIQATTHVRNVASQRVLEKAGFRKEGILRRSFLSRGEWTDTIFFSILREEWKEPKILTKTT